MQIPRNRRVHGGDEEPVDADEAKSQRQDEDAEDLAAGDWRRLAHAVLFRCASRRWLISRSRVAVISSGVHARNPSPDLKPSRPAATYCSSNALGRSCRSSAGIMVWWMSSVRSSPTMSAFSSGPNTGSRSPKLFL